MRISCIASPVVGAYAVSVDETAYYLRRAAEELARAEHSSCAQAAEAHREMHRRYVAMVEQDIGNGRADERAAPPHLASRRRRNRPAAEQPQLSRFGTARPVRHCPSG